MPRFEHTTAENGYVYYSNNTMLRGKVDEIYCGTFFDDKKVLQPEF